MDRGQGVEGHAVLVQHGAADPSGRRWTNDPIASIRRRVADDIAINGEAAGGSSHGGKAGWRGCGGCRLRGQKSQANQQASSSKKASTKGIRGQMHKRSAVSGNS